MSWIAQAPANIALIKYMGKKDDDNNIPDNPSLSYTLDNLLSSVTLENIPGKKDHWEPLFTPGAEPFTLTKTAQERFLKHLSFLKDHFNYQGAFVVRSSNNFPTGSGLASSASSFAALTLCAIRALCEIQNTPMPSIEAQAQLSRIGSGSSCRSFFSPWALWENDTVRAIELPYPKLLHQVIIISHEEKQVSSREAHQRVKTSPFYIGRAKRADDNLQGLLDAFKTNDWHQAYVICWREFQDIHRLFETSATPFTYMTDATKNVLDSLEAFWQEKKDGPIVTMDAGSNIHLLYKPSQADLAQAFKCDYLLGEHDVL
jgi:diphosphomevalonate decarboxylase